MQNSETGKGIPAGNLGFAETKDVMNVIRAYVANELVAANSNPMFRKAIDSMYKLAKQRGYASKDQFAVDFLVNSKIANNIVDSDYIKQHADSAYILSAADSAYILTAADSAYIKTAADSDYIKFVADSAYIQTAADSDYVKTFINTRTNMHTFHSVVGGLFSANKITFGILLIILIKAESLKKQLEII